MIVVDTSVLIAILLAEPEKDAFIEYIVDHPTAHLSAVSLQEAGMIMRSRRGETGVDDLYELAEVLGIRVEAYDTPHVRRAIDAFARFGKGMGSPARLNFGDCAAYALAATLSLPLLYKGDDFAATDIPRAAVIV